MHKLLAQPVLELDYIMQFEWGCSTLARRSRESGHGIEVYGTSISNFLQEPYLLS